MFVNRKPWGYDPSYDRVEAFDGDGNHLGVVRIEKTTRVNTPGPIGDGIDRRGWLKALLVALISPFTGRGA